DGGGFVRGEVLGLGEGEAGDRGLGQVVEHVHAVVVGVVLGRAVRHLDHEAAGVADEQRQRGVAGDEVRVDGAVQHAQPGGEIVLPERGVPLDELVPAPYVVDQHG